ncbi:MAG: hypothetical protein LBL49_00630 [Clostridiales Family XIII bacterium]|nr:hypothetical protein [Clostridiales Family XIII bacterium]
MNELSAKIENSITQYQQQEALKTRLDQSEQSGIVIGATDPNLEFLKEQIESHQDFIERERETLIWMLGVIVAIAGIILTFIGIKSKQDVEKIIDEHYKNEINKQFTKLLDGEENVKYLKKKVLDEKAARQESVLFILQKENALEAVIQKYKKFLDSGNIGKELVSVRRQSDGSIIGESRMSKILNDYDFVVYEAAWEYKEDAEKSKKEPYVTSGSEKDIKLINKCCMHKKKGAIFYTSKANLVCRSELDDNFCETVNSPNKLCQSLDSLLYHFPASRG